MSVIGAHDLKDRWMDAPSKRSLPIRKRVDLQVAAHPSRRGTHWVVKHPVTLEYFHFSEEEFALLQLLDGDISLAEIKAHFEEQFFPQQVSILEIERFLGTLYEAGLVDSLTAEQGVRLHEVANRRQQQRQRQTLLSPLLLRLPAVNCGRILRVLEPASRPLFSAVGFAMWCLLAIAASMLVAINFETFLLRMPKFDQFFGPANWTWLFLVLLTTKVAHEFGHALACRRLGAKSEKIGVMFLAFLPCLYCDVSDCCMLPSRWKRAAVAAAGMYVEIGLASLATFVWWWSSEGMVNQLALAVMLACSVTTLVFNANPLMKLDGYYILADCVGIHNLAEKASTLLRDQLSRLFLGWCPDRPLIPERQRPWLLLYGVLSFLYRIIVLTVILLFVYRTLEAAHLKSVGQFMAIAVLTLLLVSPMIRLMQFFLIPGVQRKVRKRNVLLGSAISVAALSAICWLPVPRTIMSEFEVQPRDAETVYAEVSGRLHKLHVKPGQQVQQGQLLAELSNEELALSLVSLQRQQSEYEAQLEFLLQQRFQDSSVLGEIPHVHQSIQGLEEQVIRKQEEIAKLRLIAPRAGTVMPIERRAHPLAAEHSLEQWSGSLLEEINLGALIQQGEKICRLGDPSQMQAMAVVDQSEVARIQPGQLVHLKLKSLPGKTWTGRVSDISKIDLDEAPVNLSTSVGGSLASYEDETGKLRTLRATYSVLVPIDHSDSPLTFGTRGEARFALGQESMGSRVYQSLQDIVCFPSE